ncbi:hypothetical protein KNU09_gp89 [Gordonia phage TillyBobJoe]|uniref:Uncharacterized protein n=5 Tax=Wizardvirus TaxID=2169658 RepID=A0A385DUT0_9CAUD|nr:hypothetical protein KNT95_gp91 [Gordonia phage Danyall]YP_010098252.1 hypothetical protein KNU09_gp89 [Gordonia phage TillyBobJoe]YP_010100892.1 hypothetical protein KNU39_gp90 [Gordonia phage Mutzi]YP_010102247.1 hypothetical protein KNU55_gp94 [Gordonia phage Barb]YP_010103697.1 hypothetical protein KNU68_gp93 [Gordonia phage Nubi]QWY84776.1 hypothetical protein SEA_YUNGMONEY_90 [Gordonia phage YungMoney]QZD98839.1 hypothetical protein SEA_PINKCOFFEE_92 [Gordonia phage PinkCoffee]WNM73
MSTLTSRISVLDQLGRTATVAWLSAQVATPDRARELLEQGTAPTELQAVWVAAVADGATKEQLDDALDYTYRNALHSMRWGRAVEW